MKKISLLIAISIITSGVTCLSMLGVKLNSVNSSFVTGYTFTNYNSSSPSPLVGNAGESVASSSNGEVAYGTNGEGLSIGKVSGVSYNFNNFTTTNGLVGNTISSVAYNSIGTELAVGENNDNNRGEGLQIFSGRINSTNPTITNYNSSNANFLTGPITGLAFFYNQVSNSHLLVVSFGRNPANNAEGGISIGNLDNDNKYEFTKFTASDNSNFAGLDATCVAIDINSNKTGNVIAVGTKANGINVGVSNSSGNYDFTNYDSSDFSIFDTEITGVGFNSKAGLAVSMLRESGDNKAGLAYGSPSGFNDYTSFMTYENSDTKSNSNYGTGLAFNSNSYLSLATASGGLSVGSENASGDGYTFNNYNTSSPDNGNLASDDGKAIAFQPNSSNLFYASDAGLDVGQDSDKPSVSFDLSDFSYDLTENNSYSLNNVKFLAAFVGNNNEDGYYIQMLIKAHGSESPIYGIYLTNTGTIPDGVPTDSANSIDVKTNDPLTNYNYSIDNGSINSLEANTKYNVFITYGNSQNNREKIATPVFSTPKAISNSFDASKIQYTTNVADYLTISAIAFDFSSSLKQVIKNNNYIFISIGSAGDANLVGLYLTIDGQLPTNHDTSISDLLTTQEISDSNEYNATNLSAQFAYNMTYTVQYFVGNDQNSTLTGLSDGVEFKTRAGGTGPDEPINPNLGANQNTSAIVGGVVGGFIGFSVLAGMVSTLYIALRRKKRHF